MRKFLFILCTLFFISCSSSKEGLFDWVGDSSYKSPNHVEVSQAVNQMEGLDNNWWNNTAFYHIWVKSFYDSDGDGCGDLKGVQEKLDYIKDLGCDGICFLQFLNVHIRVKTLLPICMDMMLLTIIK